jgi:hypothetical protein
VCVWWPLGPPEAAQHRCAGGASISHVHGVLLLAVVSTCVMDRHWDAGLCPKCRVQSFSRHLLLRWSETVDIRDFQSRVLVWWHVDVNVCDGVVQNRWCEGGDLSRGAALWGL